MAQARLTKDKVEALVKAGKRVSGLSDGDGLTFCISGSGTATWELRYRYGGRPRWLTLGRYPDIDLADARKRATKARVKVWDGVDPVAERRRSKLALTAAKSFAELAEDFMLRGSSKLKQESRYELRRYFDADLIPRLGRLRVDEITGTEIVLAIEQIAKRSLYVAHRAFEILNKVFKHGVAKHIAKRNPCDGLTAAAIIGKKEQVHETVSLDEAQLRGLFTRLPAIGRANALCVKILLATGARKMELLAARWENVDLETAIWRIPGEEAKNGRAFDIPLPGRVVGWFGELQEMACGSPWVLPGRNRREPMNHATLNAALSRLPEGLPHFTVHDLRRTARTWLGRLGIDVIVAEKCLNHTLGGLIDVYDRGDYLRERRQALELLADFLAACEEGRPWNITPLQAAA